MYFLKNLLLYSQACFRQITYIVMMTKEGSTNKNCKFHDPPGKGFLCWGEGMKSYSENALFL